tara:strand:+ start:440 stop:748 length:309 start_codon:yes stop_codon:yes gene_type:complete
MYIYKTIVQHHTVKNKAKLQFAFVDKKGDFKPVSWKAWNDSSLKDMSSDFAKNTVKSILKEKAKENIEFSRLVMLNAKKSFNEVMSFLDVEGIKVSKAGIKF